MRKRDVGLATNLGTWANRQKPDCVHAILIAAESNMYQDNEPYAHFRTRPALKGGKHNQNVRVVTRDPEVIWARHRVLHPLRSVPWKLTRFRVVP